MNDTDPSRVGSRLLNVCFGILMAAIALWLAVEIIRSIWLWLVGVALVGYGLWLMHWRRSRW